MGYHVESKDIPDANAMPGLAQQQVNMLILLHFVRYFLVRYSELRFDQQGDMGEIFCPGIYRRLNKKARLI